MSKKNFVELKLVMIMFVGMIFTNLENQFTTTKMASIPFKELHHKLHGNSFPWFTWD
jgi:hypothetical protein